MSRGENSILVQTYILHSARADPAVNRIVREDGRVRITIVSVPGPAAVEVTVELVEKEGVQLIKLDGGLGMMWAAKAIEAVDGRIPVGAVTLGRSPRKARPRMAPDMIERTTEEETVHERSNIQPLRIRTGSSRVRTFAGDTSVSAKAR